MKLLIDSDFLFGLFVQTDPHYSESKRLGAKFGPTSNLFVSNLVIYETATVISYKDNHKSSLIFLDKLPSLNLQTIVLDSALEEMSWKIFKTQTKKGTSFVDCTNLAILEKYKLDGILSFDLFYPKHLRIV